MKMSMGSGINRHVSNKMRPCDKTKASASMMGVGTSKHVANTNMDEKGMSMSANMMGTGTKNHSSNVVCSCTPKAGVPGGLSKGNAKIK